MDWNKIYNAKFAQRTAVNLHNFQEFDSGERQNAYVMLKETVEFNTDLK